MSGPVRAVGLDLGERRIGVAVSDRGGTLAVGHGVIERCGDERADRERLAEMIRELEAEQVVVGLPLSLDGSRGPAAERAEREAAALAEALADAIGGIPVALVDERLTTVAATRQLAAAGVRSRQRRLIVDEVAATILLQTWLDGRRAVPSGPETEPS